MIGTSRYMQNLNIPTPDIKSHVLQVFNGGINNVNEPSSTQAYDLINMSFSDSSLMEKRTGLINTGKVTAMSSSLPITLIDEFKPYVGENKLITANNVALYVDNVLLTAVQGQVRGTTFMNKYWFVDGVDIFIYDGTTVKKLKNPPVGFTPAVAPATVGVWGSNATHLWYEPCKAEMEDAFKGANVIPIAPRYICARKNRLYLAGCKDDVQNVFISDIQNAFYFPVTLPLQYNPNGEKITGLKEFMDQVIVGKSESVWAIYGSTNRLDNPDELFVAKQVATHAGVYCQESMQLMHNYLVFMGNDGVIYKMTTPNTDVRLITTTVLSKTLDISKFPLFIKRDSSMICYGAVYFNDEYWIRINDKVLVYNYQYMSWTIYDSLDAHYFFNLNGMRVIGDGKGRILRQKIYFNYIDETTAPEIVEESSHAFSDYTSTEMKAIPAFWKTKRMDMDMPAYYKFFRDIFVVTSTYRTINAYVDMLFEVDYDDFESSFRISNRVAIFGISLFGERFLSKDITQSIPTRIGRRGRYLSITLRNNDMDGPLKIHEIGVDFTIRGRR